MKKVVEDIAIKAFACVAVVGLVLVYAAFFTAGTICNVLFR